MPTERPTVDRPGAWLALAGVLAAIAAVLVTIGLALHDLAFAFGIVVVALAILAVIGAGCALWVEARVQKVRCPDPQAHLGEAAQAATQRRYLREINLDLEAARDRLEQAISSKAFWSKSQKWPTRAWENYRTYLMQCEGMGQVLYWLKLTYKGLEEIDDLRTEGRFPVDKVRSARTGVIAAETAIRERLEALSG